jgi:hypothetical protein
MNVLVIGRAKTGTTVIAKTIQNSMTNTLFRMEPKSIFGFMEPPDANLITKIIFEHWSATPHLRLALLNSELPVRFDRSIMIVRDPRDELISRMFYIAYGYLKQGKITREKLQPWRDIVAQKETHPEQVTLKSMISVLNELLGVHINPELKNTFGYFKFVAAQSEKCRSLVVRYEDFIKGEVSNLEAYLGFPLTPERSTGQFNNRVFRTGTCDNWKSFFTPSDIEEFKALHHDEMQAMGYTDWQLAEQPTLDPQHGSLYLDRIFDEAEASARPEKP